MIDVGKVKSTHTRRDAIVYIRQSHPSQVENNRESTARQYALMEKAVALGWAKSQVTTIDEDLGVSGKVFVKRSGFDHLNAEVTLGRVGILLGLEVSRLARSNADWYRLLDTLFIPRIPTTWALGNPLTETIFTTGRSTMPPAPPACSKLPRLS